METKKDEITEQLQEEFEQKKEYQFFNKINTNN